MNINPISLTSPNTPSTTRSATSTSSESSMFMTLLVAQLKNQDPLQPQDGAAFVAQLAQFNSLDQLVGIRHSIELLATQIHNGQNNNSSETSR